MNGTRFWTCFVLMAAILFISPTGIRAEEKKAEAKKAKPAAKKPKPDFPPFDKAMKDYTEVPTAEPAFINLWYNKKKDSLRAQIPSGLIGKQFLIASSISGGPVATGFQLDHFLAYFENMNKNLVLMRVDPRHVEGNGEPISHVIKRSYGGDLILKSIPIVTKKGSDPVIDLDSIFKADFSGIGRFLMSSANPALSKWAKYKTFPENLELSVDLAFMQKGGAGRRMGMHYSISKIPESAKGYKPRAADDRIGYFMTVRKDWTKEHDSRTLFDRHINRWRLEKRDPKAEMSAPKDPIIWYIEKTVPLKYRRWVKEGILEWNKAFEKCGFLDAVVVVQQEDYDKNTKDLDPEDVRYNFFRWIVSGRAFAMGPSRAHPLTGQIFDADIVFDDSMVRVYTARYEQLTAGEESWEAYNPFLEDFYAAYPQWRFRSARDLLLPNVRLQDDPDETFRRNLMRHLYEQGRPMCEFATGMEQQMKFAIHALEAKGLGRCQEDFIGQIVKEIVAHEVGHCLGLRHNFKASTWLPMKEIRESTSVNEATVGSVMDYNPAIVSPRGVEQGSFVTRTIGPYDYWAIEYGYRPAGKPYKDEKEMLKTIAGRVAEAGLDYGTDEDTFGFLSPDPRSNRFDAGSNVMEFARGQIELADSLLADFGKWAVKEGESFTKVRRVFSYIMAQRARSAGYAARFPGGQYVNRDHRGDANARSPIQVVDAEQQRESLRFVCDKVFAEDAYEIDADLLALFAPGRFWHWDSDDFDFFVDFNVHDYVAAAQFGCLRTLTNPFTIGRIHDNEVRFGDGQEVYTLAGHLTTLNDEIWSELDDKGRKGTDAKPFIHSFRRNLQRMYSNILLDMVLSKPGGIVPADANAIARLCLRNLSKKMAKALDKAKLDTASEAHLSDIKNRIDRALDAHYTVGGRQAAPSFLFFREAREQPTDRTVPVLPRR